MKITINLDEWTVTEERNPVNIKLVALKGEKGDTGADGTVEFDSLTPAQKAELKGEDGDDYILTDQDKQDIADIVATEADTGWTDMSSYCLTTAINVSSFNMRRIGNVVWVNGVVSLKDALAQSSYLQITSVFPEAWRVSKAQYYMLAGDTAGTWIHISGDGYMRLRNRSGAQLNSGNQMHVDCCYVLG